jgi:serine/threonine-protein kinase
VVWGVLRAHHVPLVVEEWMFLLIVTGWSLVWAGFAWLLYISLEPFVRKWWPHTLISWARLLSGRVRDPLVGRDVLVGLLAGVLLVTVLIVRVEAYTRLGIPVKPLDQWYPLEALRSMRYFLGLVVYFTLDTLNFALGALGTLLLIRVAVRNTWLSGAIWMLVVASLNLGGGGLMWDLPFGLAIAGLTLAVLLQFGLVSTAVMLLYTDFMTRLPVTLDAASWYIALSVLALLLVGMLAAYGFVVALAGRRPFAA